jgi:hypothetical protein
MSRHHFVSRRDFLKLAGAGLGSVMLASCKKSLRLTAEPLSNMTPLPPGSGNVTPLPPGTTADTILAYGRIMTVDASNSIAEAIALKGDKILCVGSNQEINSLGKASTKVINLNGRTVTPGLIDPHIHFRIWGLQNTYYTPFMPPDVKDTPSLQSALKKAIKSLKPGEWLMGYYQVLADKMVLTRQDLDASSPQSVLPLPACPASPAFFAGGTYRGARKYRVPRVFFQGERTRVGWLRVDISTRSIVR